MGDRKHSIHDFIQKHKRNAEKTAPYNERLCPYCNGSGINPRSPTDYATMQPQRCSVCGGRGRVPR